MRLKVSLLLILVVALGGCSSASKSLNDQMIADVQEFSVDGVDVLLRSSTATPVISAVLFIKGGNSVTPAGALNTTEDWALRIAAGSGTQLTSKSEFRRAMLRMGSSVDALAGRDFSIVSLKCVRETWDSTWRYFGDVITRPAFDQVEFDNLRANTLVGLGSARNDADSYSHILADSIYFAGHPYCRSITAADANAETIENLRNHYKAIMVKARLLLSVVGNVTKAELIEKLRTSGITNLPQGSYTDVPLSPPVKAFSPGAYLYQFARKLPTNYTLAYYLIPSKGDSDYYPYVRLRNFFGGFVFNHIRVQNNLAYAPTVDEEDFKTSIGIVSFQTSYVDSAVKIVDDDVDFFQENLIRESAIREGVGRWTTSNYVKAETTGSQALSLGEAKLLTGDWRNAFVSYEKLASVTPEELQHAALKYLRNFNWVVVGDTAGIDKELLMSR